MGTDETVKVFSYRVFDLEAGCMRLARGKAPRRLIEGQLGGEVLAGTGQDVALVELDEFGRYMRIATGWGELP